MPKQSRSAKTRKSKYHQQGQNILSMQMKEFFPATKTQESAASAFDAGKHLLLCGYAGTGKTYLASNFALQMLGSGQASQVIIVRSAVASRDIGFLPGDEQEKMAVYERAYAAMFHNIFGRGDSWEILKKHGIVQFTSTSFLRGLTFDNAVLIVDEFQNMGDGELNTLMTRVGENCRVILCGDQRQADLSSANSGFRTLMKVIPRMGDQFSVIEFGIQDIVRSKFVKDWIINLEAVRSADRSPYGINANLKEAGWTEEGLGHTGEPADLQGTEVDLSGQLEEYPEDNRAWRPVDSYAGRFW